MAADPNAIPGQVIVSESTPATDAPLSDRAKARADKEAQAAADQAVADNLRGYREIEWKPGITMYQSVDTQHTAQSELDMVAYVAEHRASAGTVAPPKGSPFA